MKTIREDSEMSINLPEALEVCSVVWFILMKKLDSDGLAGFDYMHCIMMCLEEFI